jgi:thioredoxin:protein disulfide reductase
MTHHKLFRGFVCLLMIAVSAATAGNAQTLPVISEKNDSIFNTELPKSEPAPTKTESNPFKMSIQAVPNTVSTGQSMKVHVRFEIAPRHQIYAKETSVTPIPAPGIVFGEVRTLTPTVEKNDPYLGIIRVYKEKAEFELPVSIDRSVEPGAKTLSVEVGYTGCTEEVCFLPEKKTLEVNFTVVPGTGAAASSPVSADIKEKSGNNSLLETNPFRKTAEKFGLIGVLAAAFFWGLLASLTPCVYPMIPITVSVIGSNTAGSIFRGFMLSVCYVLGMSVTYSILGTVAALSGGLFGEYANHPAVRIIVAGVFVILALSMFDFFYIQMPSAISSRLGGRKGTGPVGIFLTGAAAGMVVGPCVGPMLVGLLIYIAAVGSKIQGFLILWSFALGLGMIFLVIGTFSGMAASLPKAGIWMEKIKHFFGVLMLGAALYYVEPLIPERTLSLILGAFLICIGVFIGGLDPLNAESGSWKRLWKTAGIVFLALGICYAAKFTLNGQMQIPANTAAVKGIVWLNDEAAGLSRAAAQNQPVMIDFTAEWCAACKKLERETFIAPDVIKMSEHFVCIRIDCTDAAEPEVRQLQKKYEVKGLPTIIFTDSQGNVLPERSVTEFINPEKLLERMRQVRQGL